MLKHPVLIPRHGFGTNIFRLGSSAIWKGCVNKCKRMVIVEESVLSTVDRKNPEMKESCFCKSRCLGYVCVFFSRWLVLMVEILRLVILWEPLQ